MTNKNINMPLSEKRMHTGNWFDHDIRFNQLYPSSIQLLARHHWTPLVIARKAASFLASENEARILDIGSGVGKFCLAAAFHKPHAFFTGIEQRENLVHHANAANEILHLENALFIHGNFTQIDFRHYDHFYFYNAFYENLAGTDKIDECIEYSGELYNYYNRYLFRQLEQKPPGTRLASFHSLGDEIPPGYHAVGVEMEGLLKFWIKI
jgi:SAM-dependent methyltransferase